jgi:hypothetical protein
MQIRFLGRETDHGDSPTLYATDQGTYLVQGWKVSDPKILARLEVPEGETVVEVYARLMNHLAKDGLSGVVTSQVPPIVYVKDNGNLVIQGRQVTDRQTLTQMDIPDHEEVVEIDKAVMQALVSTG